MLVSTEKQNAGAGKSVNMCMTMALINIKVWEANDVKCEQTSCIEAGRQWTRLNICVGLSFLLASGDRFHIHRYSGQCEASGHHGTQLAGSSALHSVR